MTMNEMDGDTRHEYDRYANEVQQLEWERAEQARKLRWVEDSLRQALSEFDAEHPDPTTSTDTHVEQAQHHSDEHTHGMAVTADKSMTGDVGDVKPYWLPADFPADDDTVHVKSTCLGRLVWGKTGVVAPDGVEEESSTMLCWRCDREAEYAGYCEEHYAQWQDEQSEQEMLEHDEWVDDLWSAEELERAEREAEEGRDDH